MILHAFSFSRRRLGGGKKKFPPEALAELAYVPGGRQWTADCDGVLSYDEFLEVLACCDEATICRLNGERYQTWGYRKPTGLMRDLAQVAGTGGYVQSVEPILTVPSLRETLEWYRKHLGWDGCDWEGMEDYGYTSLHAYTGGCESNTGKEFKGLHLWKGTPPDQPVSYFCFVLEVEALRQRIVQSGWNKVTDIVDRGWGCKGFCCTDLNGYRLEFCQWLAGRAGRTGVLRGPARKRSRDEAISSRLLLFYASLLPACAPPLTSPDTAGPAPAPYRRRY